MEAPENGKELLHFARANGMNDAVVTLVKQTSTKFGF